MKSACVHYVDYNTSEELFKYSPTSTQYLLSFCSVSLPRANRKKSNFLFFRQRVVCVDNS